jgi:hypothetical protein
MKFNRSEMKINTLKYLNAIPETVDEIPSYDEFAKYTEQQVDELLKIWDVDSNAATELKEAWANHPSRSKLFAIL